MKRGASFDVTRYTPRETRPTATATATVGTLRTTSAQARPEQRRRSTKTKAVREAAGRIVAAYSRACRDHSVPTPSRIDIAILSTQAANLLAGGYDERDIQAEALVIVGEFDLYHGHKGMTQLQRRVQQLYEERRIAEHEAVVGPVGDVEARRKVAAVAPEVAAAMGRPLARVPGRPGAVDPRDSGHWSRRCAENGCQRTALYGRERCGTHER